MADEVCDGTKMIGELFGEGQGVTYETGDALPQRVSEPLDMIGVAGWLRDGFGWRSRNDSCRDGILVGIERGMLAGHCRTIGPQLFCTVVTALSSVERKDLPRLFVHSDPDPWLLGLLRHEAPHRIGFPREPAEDHSPWGCHGLPMEMIRQRCKAGGDKAPTPAETDAHHPTNTMQGDLLGE